MASRANEALTQADASIYSAQAVTLGSDVNFPRITRGIYVGVTGNLTVQFAGDADAATVTLIGLAAGVWHPMQIQKIINATTTVASVVAGY